MPHCFAPQLGDQEALQIKVETLRHRLKDQDKASSALKSQLAEQSHIIKILEDGAARLAAANSQGSASEHSAGSDPPSKSSRSLKNIFGFGSKRSHEPDGDDRSMTYASESSTGSDREPRHGSSKSSTAAVTPTHESSEGVISASENLLRMENEALRAQVGGGGG